MGIGIDRLGVTKPDPVTGQRKYFIKPWRDRRGTPPSIVANPEILGTVEPGQTVAAGAGSYLPADLILDGRAWTLRNAAGATVLTDSGASFAIPTNAPTGTLELEEVMRDSVRRTVKGRRTVSVTAKPGYPDFTSAPVLSSAASPDVGVLLTMAPGGVTGSPAPTSTYRWLWGTTILGTGLTYRPTEADRSRAIFGRQVASNSVGTKTADTNSVTIPATPLSAPQWTSNPTITRNATSGQYTATDGVVVGDPAPTVERVWQVSDTEKGTYTDRSGGATADPLKWIPAATATYIGKWIRMRSTARSAAGVATVYSAPVQYPEAAAEGFSVDPKLSGDAPMGSTLTVSHTAKGSPTKTGYEWHRSGRTEPLSTTANSRKSGIDDVDATLTVKVTLTYASGRVYEKTTNGIKVAAAVAWPALEGITALGANDGGNVLDKPYVRFEDAYRALVPENLDSNFYHHAGAIAAYEAWRGNTTCNDYVEGAIKKLLTKGNEPNIQMSYGAMYPYASCVMFYYASITPAVWAKFTTAQKTQQDRLIKLGAIAAAAVARNDSTDNHRSMTGEGGANATELSGDSNPNIRMPHYAFPQLLCAYMGASEADTFMSGLTEKKIKDLRDDIVDALPRVGLAFADTRPSNSPSWSKIVSKSVDYITGGLALTDHAEILERELIHMYSEAVFLGLNDGEGSKQGTEVGKTDGNYYKGRFMNVDRVKNLQRYKDIAGAIGMSRELNTADGGGLRSSMSYHCFADTTATLFPLVMFTSGLVSPGNTRMKGILSRLRTSQAFCQLADDEGYYSAAQNRTGLANNHDWKLTTTKGKHAIVAARRSLAQLIIDKIEAA